MTELLRVSGRGFVCGAIVVDDEVVECAPYLRSAARRSGWRGRSVDALLDVALAKGWRAELLR